MWLRRLINHKQASPSGGAGSDMGVASDSVLGIDDHNLELEEPPNTKKRRRKRKICPSLRSQPFRR